MNRLFPALLACSAIAVPASLQAAVVGIESEGPVIELTMNETVEADPDIVTIGAGVTTEAPTAVEAMRLNAVEMRRVIDRIKALGVDEKDIQTTGINLNARYDYNRTTQRNVFRGYAVMNRVSVKLREIDETGEVLDALVAAGATDLSGPSFSIEDDTAAKQQARERAMAGAREQAEAYARMLGHSRVRVLEVNETIVSRGPVPMLRTVNIEEAAAPPPPQSAPVQPGRVGTGVVVTVKFEVVTDQGD